MTLLLVNLWHWLVSLLILLSRQLTEILQATERKDHTVNIVAHKDTHLKIAIRLEMLSSLGLGFYLLICMLSTLRQPPFTVIIKLHSILPQTQFSMNVRNTLSLIVISSGTKFWKDSLSLCTSPLTFNELTSLRRHFPLLFCKLTYSSWELSTYILHLVGGITGHQYFG